MFRAYIASDGNDANACTLIAPCRLLPAALTAVANGGEIWMLNSANYNTSQVNITKSVTILAVPGVVGSVVATTAGADAINISTAGVNVTLRNLVIVPIPGSGGVNGIHMTDGAKLSVENAVISNFTIGHGIRVSTAATVRIVDTLIRDCSSGIWLQSGVTAIISRATVLGNSNVGIRVIPAGPMTSIAAVSDSVVTGNGIGISGYSDNASGVSRISVIRSTITNNSPWGVRSDSFLGTVLVTLSDSMVTGNAVGLSHNGTDATLESMGNNTIRQNTGPNEGTITTVAPS
jgi:nitrous oxidase accessory protein NosD